MEVNEREAESRAVAGHLYYLLNALGQTSSITKEIKKAKDEYYGLVTEVDNWTALLCRTIRHMTDADKDQYIYDGNNPDARALAAWWDRHQKWDKERKDQEQKEKQQKKIQDLSKQFQKLPIAEQERLLALSGLKIT
jgi:hypothetical protein